MKVYQITFDRVGKQKIQIKFRDRIHAANFLWKKMAENTHGIPLCDIRNELREWVTRELPGHFKAQTVMFVAQICEV